MLKNRVISTPDYGYFQEPGPMTWAASSGMNEATAIAKGYDTPAGLLAAYANGYQNRSKLVNETAPYLSGFERFFSTERKEPLYNNCDHMIANTVCLPFGCTAHDRTGNYLHKPYWRYANTATTLSVSQLLKHFSADLSPARRMAWNIMQPSFEGNISMFNFIVELKDFRSLYKFFSKQPIRKLRNLFRKKRFLAALKDPSKPMAELHLANEFALKPLLSDIVTIACQINEVVTEVQKSFSDAGLGVNTRHYTENFLISKVSTWTAYYETKYPERFMGKIEDLTFTATLRYSYGYTARSPIDAFMRYWGIIPTAEAIWNSIPFSFLLDYVLTVGKSLGAMARDPNVNIQPSQYCESLLSRVSSGVHIKPDQCLSGMIVVDGKLLYPTQPILVNGDQSTIFTRRVTTPDKGAVLPRIKVPTMKQGTNLAALLRCFL